MTEAGWRSLTAFVLIPVVVIVVLELPPLAFQAALVLVLAAAAWEWSRLVGLAPAPAYAAAVGVCLVAVAGLGEGPLGEWLAWLGVAWWLLAFVAIVRFRGAPAYSTRTEEAASPRSVMRGRGSSAASFTRARRALAGGLVLVPAGAALAILHARPGGPALVMTLLAVVWAADSGAWFAGRRFGRTRLAPRVSPGKTWEGVAGGMLAGAAAGAASSWWLVLPPRGLLIAAVLAAGASVIGDLYESLCKRRAGVKDSGGLLPGHGGLLDRIDGLTAAAPVYAVATAG